MLLALPFWFMLASLLILGAIWGSFIAALCSRWPRGESVMRGRSACDQCKQPIAAYDLIPILSYFVLNGKCRSCRAEIGRTPVVTESAAALIGAAPLLFLPANQAFAAAIFGWLLLPLVLLDFRHLWLPDRLSTILAGWGLIAGPMLTPDLSIPSRLVGAVVAFATLEIIRHFYRRLRGGDGMGAGDPKLFGAIGLWLGWQALPMTLLAASAIGIAALLAKRDAERIGHAALPFGSYLGIAAYGIALTV
jgi:leader peptidase (prepilin peptidase) / N-methyltransferase